MVTIQAGSSATPRPGRRPSFGTPEFYISKLEDALEVAEGQPLTFTDLMVRLRTIWCDDERQLVLERIEGFVPPAEHQRAAGAILTAQPLLSENQQEELASALTDLVGNAEKLPASDRMRADQSVGRLCRLLTAERAWRVVGPWFGDRRKFRRSVVVRVLLDYGVPHALAAGVIEQYRATRDRGLLKLIGRNPYVAALLEESDVRRALAVPPDDRVVGEGQWVIRDNDTRYWHMRAIEAYLIGGRVPSDDIAFEHPMAFAWAVGRQAHSLSLPLLMRVLERYRDDPEFVWRSMRAIGRTGTPADIEHVRAIATALVDAARAAESQARSA